MPGIIHCGSFLLFAAFALLLVATISAPVVNRISFLDVTGAGTRSTFGTFGYCTNINASPSGCTSAKLGYNLTSAARTILDHTWTNTTVEALTKALILHPLACGLAFLSLLVSLCSDRLGFLFASFLALLAFLTSLAVTIIDFVLFGIIRREVNDNDNATGRTAQYGNAAWMVLAATVVLFFSVFFVLFSCCTARRNRRTSSREDGYGNTNAYNAGGYVGNGPQMGYAPTKTHWWQRK